MKQLLFLFLFPCLALAQYTGNAGQKITLGEQTTADGLVWRGVASIDTVTATSKITRANKQDTSAFLLLDTVTNLLWHYKTASNGWIQAGGGVSVSSFSAGTTGLTPSTVTTGAVTLGGTLAVANGGTGSGTQNFVDLTNTQSIGGVKTFTSGVIGANFRATSTTIPADGMYRPSASVLGFSTNGVKRMEINAAGNVGIPNFSTNYKLFIDGDIAFSGKSGSRGFVLPDTLNHTGFIYFQAGPGSSATGGALNLFGSGHATKPGWVVAGISQGAGSGATEGRFTVNNQALDGGTELFTVLRTGNVGIGTTAPAVALHVVGNGRFTTVGAGTFGNNLNITSDGTLTTATSDEKYKYNILPINYGLNTILQLKPVNFQWIEGEENDLGFIAQDVADIIPEAVNTNWNSDLLMRYESIIPILTKAIQEQNLLIKALEQRLLILENK